MISKDALLKKIDEALDLEKRLIPLLNKHISSSLFASGMDKAECDSITERFKDMALTAAKHVELLNGVRDEASRGKRDVC